MSDKAAIQKLDALLKPLGFARRKATWNRNSHYLIEVVDVQASKAGDTVTVNAGVLDTRVYVKLWGEDPPGFIEEPQCTVRTRVGDLLDGKDLWWEPRNPQAIEEIVHVVDDTVLPFLERMGTLEAMERWLVDNDVVKQRYPLPIVNLAILQIVLGKVSEGCGLLLKLKKRPIGAWRKRVEEIAQRINCAER